MRTRPRTWGTTLIDAHPFWQWFVEHSETLAALLEQDDTPTSVTPDPLWTELMARLRAIHPNLRITVVYDPDGPLGLIGATGGLVNLELISQMVVAAPEMLTWRIAILRQEYDLAWRCYHLAADLPIEDMGFTVVATNAGLQLTIYAADDPDTDTLVRQATEILLDTLYGSAVRRRFTEVVWKQAPRGFREEERIYPLNELLEVMDGLTMAVQNWGREESTFALRR